MRHVTTLTATPEPPILGSWHSSVDLVKLGRLKHLFTRASLRNLRTSLLYLFPCILLSAALQASVSHSVLGGYDA